MGYNQYQTAEYLALHGKAKQDQRKKPCLWDLKYNGQNVAIGVPYPVAVQTRKDKVKSGWRLKDFKITKHV